MRFRRANLTDARAVCAIGCASYPSALHESEHCVSAILAFDLSWVAEEEDEVVGYALVRLIDDPTWPPHMNDVPCARARGHHLYIHDVCVTPTERAHGVGKALVMHVLGGVHEYRTVTLISLEAAVWFWVQFKFKPTAIARWNIAAEYGDGAMHMMYAV